MKYKLILLSLVYGFATLDAQESITNPRMEFVSSDEPNIRSVTIPRISEKMTMDGILDEESWKSSGMVTSFWQNFPVDTASARHQTEIYMSYDAQFLYVAAKCYSAHNKYIIPSLRRDYNFPGNDNISLLFDTYNDENNAFLFGMNPFGVRREALIANGGRDRADFSSSWDNKWFGEAKRYDGYWVAEFAIPFRTLRFNEGSQKWRFNSYRYDSQINEISTWVQIRQNQIIMDLGHMGDLHFEEPLSKPGTNIALIPYVSLGSTTDFEEMGKKTRNSGIGGDAKIGITSGLNLDLTLNPDFSQVEVDDQVTNLDRFEILLPEKRQFFLENADLFGSFGGMRTNPFFSRRIGVAIDTSTGQNIQNKIQFGARLSGKINDDFRLGLMNMQTAKQTLNGLPAFNYTVAALQHNVFSRSNISMIFVNKQSTSDSKNKNSDEFNRVAGFEYRLATPSNRWTGKFYYHHVFSSKELAHNYSHSLQIQYLKPKYRLEWANLFVGEGYQAEVGFVPRRDYFLVSPEFQLFFFPKNKRIVNRHSLATDFRTIYKIGKDGNKLLPSYGLSDRQLEMSWEIEFANNSQGNVSFTNDYVFLLDDFDPTRSQEEGIVLPAGAEYTYSNFSMSYMSDQRKQLFFEFSPGYGTFFNGTKSGLAGSITYRYQPLGFISINYNLNHIKLADPFEPSTVWLVGPRIDFTFTKSIFLTTFIQYNSQFENLNINSRFQWRFRPVSDFFIVYTDNYLFEPFSQFSTRNRGLIAKLTYWI